MGARTARACVRCAFERSPFPLLPLQVSRTELCARMFDPGVVEEPAGMAPSQAGSLRGARLAVNTQTPLARFHEGNTIPTTGGVTRMLQPLLRSWLGAGKL